MKTLRLAAVIAVMTINLSAEMLYKSLDFPAAARSASRRDNVTVMVQEIAWPQLCRYTWRTPHPDDTLAYRTDRYVAYRECIRPRSSRSPAVYTLPLFDPGKH